MSNRLTYPPLMYVPQQDNTLRNGLMLLLVLAVIWFLVLPMLQSSTTKAVASVAKAKEACDKAVLSKLPADMIAAQEAINSANVMLSTASADEKGKGLAKPSAELSKAYSDLINLSCNTSSNTSGQIVPPSGVPPSGVPPPNIPPDTTSSPYTVPSTGTQSGGKPTQTSVQRWRFYQGVDTAGHDIGNFPGTLDQMKATCLSQPMCVGFNDNGWMKEKISPLNQWYSWTDTPGKGFRILLDRVSNPPPGGILEGFF